MCVPHVTGVPTVPPAGAAGAGLEDLDEQPGRFRLDGKLLAILVVLGLCRIT